MKAEMRSTMLTAAKVELFNQAHPVANPELSLVVGHFDERVARARALIAQQAEHKARSKAAHEVRDTVRRQLLGGVIRLLVDAIELANTALPDLKGTRAPRLVDGDPAFVLACERIVAAAKVNLAVLKRYGVSEELVTEANALLGSFRHVSAEAKDSLRLRKSARVALEGARSQILSAINRLDHLNQHRFMGQVEILAQWEQAKLIPRRRTKADDESGTPPVESPPSSGSGGDAKAVG